MAVPNIKTKELREDIKALVDMAATRGMYEIVLQSIDAAMNDLVEVREELKDEDVEEALEKWDEAFKKFGEREAYYYQAFLESEDRDVVDKPLFDGDYSGFEFEGAPKWPDIETPWRLGNELATIAVASGKKSDYMDGLKEKFLDSIETFWAQANELISAEQEKIAQQASAQQGIQEGGGRGYGFLPVVALGAVALVGAFGAAAGYSAAKRDAPGDYVESSSPEKHLKRAKDMGLGFAIGVAVAALVILRVTRD